MRDNVPPTSLQTKSMMYGPTDIQAIAVRDIKTNLARGLQHKS